MKNFFLSFCLAVSACTVHAQVAISASAVKDAANTPLTARLCFTPVNAAAVPTGFRVGTEQVVPNEVCGKVTSGVLVSGYTLAPSPAGILYHVYAKQANGNTVIRDYGFTAITGSTWTLDSYDPSTTVLPLATISLEVPANYCYQFSSTGAFTGAPDTSLCRESNGGLDVEQLSNGWLSVFDGTTPNNDATANKPDTHATISLGAAQVGYGYPTVNMTSQCLTGLLDSAHTFYLGDCSATGGFLDGNGNLYTGGVTLLYGGSQFGGSINLPYSNVTGASSAPQNFDGSVVFGSSTGSALAFMQADGPSGSQTYNGINVFSQGVGVNKVFNVASTFSNYGSGGTFDSTHSGTASVWGAFGPGLTSTNAIASGKQVPVKLDTSNASQVIQTITTDTGPGVVIGVCANEYPNTAGASCNPVASVGVVHLALGTGTCSIGQFVIVDTTTNGDIKCTSTYTPGTIIGTAMQAQSTVGGVLQVLMGLR